MKFRLKYRFGQKIKHLIGNDEYIIVAVQLCTDGATTYGASAADGTWKWFKEYEIELSPNQKELGFNVEL